MDMKAVVVGGGIGGLASAIALRGRGWDVEVLERATPSSSLLRSLNPVMDWRP